MRKWKNTRRTKVDQKSKTLAIKEKITSSTQGEDIKIRTKATQTKQQSNQRNRNKRISKVSITIRIKDQKKKGGEIKSLMAEEVIISLGLYRPRSRIKENTRIIIQIQIIMR